MTTNLRSLRKWCADNDIEVRTVEDRRLPFRKKLEAAGAIIEVGQRKFVDVARAQQVIDECRVQPAAAA